MLGGRPQYFGRDSLKLSSCSFKLVNLGSGKVWLDKCGLRGNPVECVFGAHAPQTFVVSAQTAKLYSKKKRSFLLMPKTSRRQISSFTIYLFLDVSWLNVKRIYFVIAGFFFSLEVENA